MMELRIFVSAANTSEDEEHRALTDSEAEPGS
jgi:hypothetical protein